MNQDDYIKVVAPSALAFLVGYFLKYLGPQANTILWNPHSFAFAVKNLNIATNSVTVQNLGRKAAERIEIIYEKKPDTYKISPERMAEGRTNNDGNFIILIESLGRNEYFSIESLHYSGPHPAIISARTKEGTIKSVEFYYQRVQPKWRSWAILASSLIGCGTAGYWAFRLIENYW